ncbi:MAG: metallophosphoesterase [Flavobacteriales bacterium]|nr:metallophosphoesterase [Flavobacteriales bacterium]
MAAGGSLRHELLFPAVSPGGSGNGVTIDVAGEMLHLLPDGAVWWASAQTLWLSDLHLGKAAHFRKHGVPIGSEPTLATLHRLREQIQTMRPVRVLLLGDLFHSDINREWEPFAGLCEEFQEVEWVLVQGNHDMIPEVLLRESGIQQIGRLDEGPFTFTHDPADLAEDFGYHVCGHVHPGIRLAGAGRQRLRLRCFHITDKQAVMPAYGAFTGMHTIDPDRQDRVFATTGEAVIEV